MEKHIKTIGNYSILFGCYTVDYNRQNKMLYRVKNGINNLDFFETQKEAEAFILEAITR
jgi:hypothetical protein